MQAMRRKLVEVKKNARGDLGLYALETITSNEHIDENLVEGSNATRENISASAPTREKWRKVLLPRQVVDY